MERLRCADDGHEPVLKNETVRTNTDYTAFGSVAKMVVLYYLECPHCGQQSNAHEDPQDATQEWNASNGEQCIRCKAYVEETHSDWCEHCYGDMTGRVP